MKASLNYEGNPHIFIHSSEYRKVGSIVRKEWKDSILLRLLLLRQVKYFIIDYVSDWFTEVLRPSNNFMDAITSSPHPVLHHIHCIIVTVGQTKKKLLLNIKVNMNYGNEKKLNNFL